MTNASTQSQPEASQPEASRLQESKPKESPDQHFSDQQVYDVAIIGTGISGSMLGSILARHGQRVVLFEAKSHPRFAIGESMILETSESMRALAELFDVPELAYFSSENFASHIGTSHGVKRHFGYLHHSPGKPHDPAHALQAVIPKEPYGHELHIYRQDSDYQMMTTAIAYGATVLQNTPVANIEIHDHHTEIVTSKGDRYRASYVVDAGGFRSLVADKFDLRTTDLLTHSRAIFTHMVNVPCFHDATVPLDEYGMPFRMSEGTLHHLFPGGWMWVIPFDNHPDSTNHLCSVGLMLDPRVHPARMEISPEEEFYSFISQFPTLAKHLQQGQAVREWTRTGRIQYSSKKVVGDRFALLGHAAGFIDPLFSKGLYVTTATTGMLAQLLLEAKKDGDYSARRFQPLETLTLNYIRENDRHIAAAYTSFARADLWARYAVLWMLGAYCELVKLTVLRAESERASDYYAKLADLHLVGGGFPGYDEVADEIYALLQELDTDDDAAITAAAQQIHDSLKALPWLPLEYQRVLAGKNHLAANKFRLSLFKGEQSFLGNDPAYRRHFFGDHTMWEVARSFALDKIKYAKLSIGLRRRWNFRQHHVHPSTEVTPVPSRATSEGGSHTISTEPAANQI